MPLLHYCQPPGDRQLPRALQPLHDDPLAAGRELHLHDGRLGYVMGSAVAHYEGIKAFSETDQTGDLKAISVPTLVLHGEDDQIVPIDASAHASIKLLRNGTLKTYPGFSHGMLTVNADVLNADLLAFIES